MKYLIIIFLPILCSCMNLHHAELVKISSILESEYKLKLWASCPKKSIKGNEGIELGYVSYENPSLSEARKLIIDLSIKLKNQINQNKIFAENKGFPITLENMKISISFESDYEILSNVLLYENRVSYCSQSQHSNLIPANTYESVPEALSILGISNK